MYSFFEMQPVEYESQQLVHKQFAVTINNTICSRCRICVSLCACFHYDNEKDCVCVNSISCKGCGVCISSCPSSAIQHIYGDALLFGIIENTNQEAFACDQCTVASKEEGDFLYFCVQRYDTGKALTAVSKGKKVVIKQCLFSDNEINEEPESICRTRNILALYGLSSKLQVE